jgi:O-Antigen ligase
MNGYAGQLKEYAEPRTWLLSLIGTLLAVVSGLIISRFGIVGLGAIVLVPAALALVVWTVLQPRIGFLIYVQLCFLINGLPRFIPIYFPFGVLADAILWLTLFGIMLNYKAFNWSRLNSPAFYLVLFWFFYTVLQAFNPEAPGLEAWVMAVRGFSVYWILVTVIALLLFRDVKDLTLIVRLWLVWSVLAAFWAFKQQYIGLTSGEVAWLNAGGAKTHMLMGRLRSFSFYSDAGQFGAEMAYTTLLCLIRVLEEKGFTQKIIYLLIAAILFWGFAVSGSRGPLFVILAGLPVYMLVRGNPWFLVVGFVIGSGFFGFLKYTSIGNTNYHVYRMRTAVSPDEDTSFQVRLDNQKKIGEYMSSRPFGAGMGSSGDWGRRFAPGSFLAETPPDSWLVKVWIEAGIIGLIFYCIIILTIIIIGAYKINKLRNRGFKMLMASLLGGFVGIFVASYGNPIVGQFPTNSIMYITIVLLFICDEIDSKLGTNEVVSL